jgi:hypothetical protein
MLVKFTCGHEMELSGGDNLPKQYEFACFRCHPDYQYQLKLIEHDHVSETAPQSGRENESLGRYPKIDLK